MEKRLVFRRKAELEELLSSVGDPSKIKTVVGLRGAGKTFLLNELFVELYLNVAIALLLYSKLIYPAILRGLGAMFCLIICFIARWSKVQSSC